MNESLSVEKPEDIFSDESWGSQINQAASGVHEVLRLLDGISDKGVLGKIFSGISKKAIEVRVQIARASLLRLIKKEASGLEQAKNDLVSEIADLEKKDKSLQLADVVTSNLLGKFSMEAKPFDSLGELGQLKKAELTWLNNIEIIIPDVARLIDLKKKLGEYSELLNTFEGKDPEVISKEIEEGIITIQSFRKDKLELSSSKKGVEEKIVNETEREIITKLVELKRDLEIKMGSLESSLTSFKREFMDSASKTINQAALINLIKKHKESVLSLNSRLEEVCSGLNITPDVLEILLTSLPNLKGLIVEDSKQRITNTISKEIRGASQSAYNLDDIYDYTSAGGVAVKINVSAKERNDDLGNVYGVTASEYPDFLPKIKRMGLKPEFLKTHDAIIRDRMYSWSESRRGVFYGGDIIWIPLGNKLVDEDLLKKALEQFELTESMSTVRYDEPNGYGRTLKVRISCDIKTTAVLYGGRENPNSQE